MNFVSCRTVLDIVLHSDNISGFHRIAAVPVAVAGRDIRRHSRRNKNIYRFNLYRGVCLWMLFPGEGILVFGDVSVQCGGPWSSRL